MDMGLIDFQALPCRPSPYFTTIDIISYCYCLQLSPHGPIKLRLLNQRLIHIGASQIGSGQIGLI